MQDVFVVRNQLAQYWGKHKKWVDGTNPKRVLTHKHEDEAVNQLVELSARDVDLRAEVIAVPVNDRRVPQVEPSEHLLADAPEPAPELEQALQDAAESGPA